MRTWVSKLVPVLGAAEAHAIRLWAGATDVELRWDNSRAQGDQGLEVYASGFVFWQLVLNCSGITAGHKEGKGSGVYASGCGCWQVVLNCEGETVEHRGIRQVAAVLLLLLLLDVVARVKGSDTPTQQQACQNTYMQTAAGRTQNTTYVDSFHHAAQP